MSKNGVDSPYLFVHQGSHITTSLFQPKKGNEILKMVETIPHRVYVTGSGQDIWGRGGMKI